MPVKVAGRLSSCPLFAPVHAVSGGDAPSVAVTVHDTGGSRIGFDAADCNGGFDGFAGPGYADENAKATFYDDDVSYVQILSNGTQFSRKFYTDIEVVLCAVGGQRFTGNPFWARPSLYQGATLLSLPPNSGARPVGLPVAWRIRSPRCPPARSACLLEWLARRARGRLRLWAAPPRARHRLPRGVGVVRCDGLEARWAARQRWC